MTKKKKIGIFLGYAPEQVLRDQGLGRLLALIIQGVIANAYIPVIACPKWYEAEVDSLLDDFDIKASQIEKMLTRRVPFILQIRTKLAKPAKLRGKFFKKIMAPLRAMMLIFRQHGVRLTLKLLATSSLLTVLSLLPFVLLAAIFSPIVLLLILLYKGLRKASAWISKILKNRVRRFSELYLGPLKKLKNNLFALRIYEEMRASELNRLIAKINHNTEIKSWLVPALFWPEVSKITVPKVLVVPDIIYADFPAEFVNIITEAARDKLELSLSSADQYICYSNYVKENHLVKRFALAADSVTVIPHAPIDCQPFLQKDIHRGQSNTAAARQILRSYLQRFSFDPYLNGFDLSEVPFFFYASQIRPHKNMLNLLKAYKKLLREELVNVKLILTGDPNGGSFDVEQIRHFRHVERLNYDVLFFPSLPVEVLAAMYHLAVCSITPTLFEGGFPFTFAEAYSVNTPSIMSDIPVVREMVDDPELRKSMLFNPYDVDEMCAKMKWAVQNRDALLVQQASLYKKLAGRTWKQVANEYIEALNAIA